MNDRFKCLVIDSNWSIEYDTQDENKPTRALRLDEAGVSDRTIMDEVHIALFSTLMKERK